MTKMKEQAIEMLLDIPDDKVARVIGFLKGLQGLYAQSEDTEAQELSISADAERERTLQEAIARRKAGVPFVPAEQAVERLRATT